MKAKRARETEALHAQASQLLALGRNELARDPAMALAYARKSLELADTPAARRFAVEVLWKGPIARIASPTAVPGLQPEETAGWLDQPVFSPNAAWLAFRNGTDGRALLFPRDGGTPRFLPRPPDGNASAFAFGPQSDLIVTPGGGSSLRLHSLPDLHEIRSIELGGSRSGGWVSDGALFTMTRPSASDPTEWSGRGPFRTASRARSHGSTSRVSSTGRSTGAPVADRTCATGRSSAGRSVRRRRAGAGRRAPPVGPPGPGLVRPVLRSQRTLHGREER